MTIICAMHEPGVGTWIGSDTQETVGHEILLLDGPKWVVGEHWAAAMTGEAVVHDIVIEHAADLLDADVTPREFHRRLVSILKEAGVEPKMDEGNLYPRWHYRLILASATELWDVDGHGHCRRSNWVANGSGCEFATGAIFALGSAVPSMPPRDAVHLAVSAAINHTNGCGGAPWVHFMRAPQ